MFQSIRTIIVFLPIILGAQKHWSYEYSERWSEDHPYCKGNLQSPIKLQFNTSEYNHRLKHLYFEKNQSVIDPPKLINEGHTAQINFQNHYILKNVAPCSEDYIVAQLHFHWGSEENNNTDGSEHLLNDRAYPLEMHIVTYSSLFPNLTQAVNNARALAVIGIFFQLSNQSNELFQPIVNALAHIKQPGQSQPIDDFRLLTLIGYERLERYYRYDGSLTTPPCYESVIWSVLQEPLEISLNQLNAFQKLHDENNTLMKKIFRPTQELGARILFRNFQENNPVKEREEQESTATRQDIQIVLLLISSLISLI